MATSLTQPVGAKQRGRGGSLRRYLWARFAAPQASGEKQPGRFGRREPRNRTPCFSPALPSRWPAKTAAKRELAQNARFELYSGTPANQYKIACRPSGRRANAMKPLAFSSEPQVRKHKGEELALLLGFRTLEKLGSSRCQRNQAF